MKGIRKLQIFNLLLLICLFSSFLTFPTTKASETKPILRIKIHRIKALDPIEEGWFEDGADFLYQIVVKEASLSHAWIINYRAEANHDDNIIDQVHSFTITQSSYLQIFIYVWEMDGDRYDQNVDISKDTDHLAISYDMKSNSIIGDYVKDGNYLRTSGEWDGSEGTAIDENDAELWFSIWDNYDAPEANAGNNVFCYVGEKVNLDGSGSSASTGSSIVKYEWDFESDGRIDAEGARTSSTFPKKGRYTVTLRVTDSIGETDTDTLIITVGNKPPTPSFTFSPEEPTIRDTIHFYDTSTDPDGTIVSWHWNFGDGYTSTIKDPTHDYADKGSYTVTLRVTDDDSNSDSTTKILTIINLAPAADFTYSPSSPKAGKDIQFTDKSTDPEGKTLKYLWDFGDGFTSTKQNPKHKFTTSGTKYVKLTVTDDEDAEDSITKSMKIAANILPEPDFSYSPENPKMNQDVHFTDESKDPDGYIVEWLWDFGDGASSTQENPKHQFKRGGEYTVRLTVTDDSYDSDDRIKRVKIIQTYDLTIEVKDILGLSISNAEIELYTGGKLYTSELTDETGKLTLVEVPEGDYEIITKVIGVTTPTTCSLTQSLTEQIQVIMSLNTTGIVGGIIAVVAILGFYLKRRKPILPLEETKIEEGETVPKEDDSLKERKKELEKERIAEMLKTFKEKYDKGEIDEETYLRLKIKYENELNRLE